MASPASFPTDASLDDVARRLHSAALRLLRRARRDDESFGLTAARSSALSVVVYAGPIRLGELARAEQVKPPTMTRLVRAMETAGLIRRRPDPEDRRALRVEATARGRRILLAAQRRRIGHLAELLEELKLEERRTVSRAADLLLRELTARQHRGPGANDGRAT